MSAGARAPGSAEEELFLQKPQTTQSPIVEPLRINKRDSRSPEPPSRQRVPQPAVFPLPPGASSSPAPLPYPDENWGQQRPYNRHGTPDSYSARKATLDKGRASPGQSDSSSPHSSSSDQARYNGPEYPTALRPQGGHSGPSTSRLAERRGNIPKPLPESPGPDTPDKEGLFQRLPRREEGPSPEPKRSLQSDANPFPDYHQQYWPPPAGAEPSAEVPSNRLHIPDPSSVNRLGSTASTSTTRAQRGSPPPPETPIVPPGEHLGGGIEARYAAAGIAGTSTLSSLQAQHAAAAQRANQYGSQPWRGPTPGSQQQEPSRRPWTPTEQPENQPHGPPTVYQGPSQTSYSPPVHASTPVSRLESPSSQTGRNQPTSALEQDLQRLHVTASPPPAYSSVSQGGSANAYPNEKQRQHSNPSAPATAAGAALAAAIGATVHPISQSQSHPAFAQDPAQDQRNGVSAQPARHGSIVMGQHSANTSPVPTGAGPASPPPLPEGWIAHLDPNSGQYYYIHLPTQSTQWEFPKGPTPLNLNEPLSPTISTYSNNPLASPGLKPFDSKPMASPGFPPSTPGYAGSVMSMQSTSSTVTGFSGPPPSSGVDMYKVAPTNGVYFGPYLRYTNMDLERGLWLGSILLVTDAPQPPTIHIHQSVDLSPNPRQLKAGAISQHQRWTFYRYDVDLQMDDHGSSKWTYAITSHLGCTRYEFLVAGRHETNWRFIATSGNDFSINVSANERSRIGGIGYMWKDVMQKHVECGGFHTQLGLGDQIYADRIWKDIPLLKQWLATSGKEIRKNAPWTAQHEDDVSHAYFHYYTSHFDQPYLREAFAQIPHVLQIDDHDM